MSANPLLEHSKSRILGSSGEMCIRDRYDAVLAENNEYMTQSQIQQILRDNYSKATAVIDAVKTDAEINASANAIVEAIKALPATVVLENKAQYLEAVSYTHLNRHGFSETPGGDYRIYDRF